MAPDQDFETSAEQPETPAPAESPRSGRRSNRGRRGRGRRRKPKAAPSDPAATAAPESTPDVGESVPETAPDESHSARSEFEEQQPLEAETAPAEPFAAEEPVHHPPPPAPSSPPRPASRLTVQAAIDEVNDITASLREALDQMDEILEMLEDLERQGDADEREIESLRRALRHLQRPRDGGPQQRGRH